MAQGPLDLAGEQRPIVAEVPLQRVAVDHDPVLVVFARDAVAEVLTVCMHFGAAVRDDDRDPRQHVLEFLGQAVDRVDDHGFDPSRPAAGSELAILAR